MTENFIQGIDVQPGLSELIGDSVYHNSTTTVIGKMHFARQQETQKFQLPLTLPALRFIHNRQIMKEKHSIEKKANRNLMKTASYG